MDSIKQILGRIFILGCLVGSLTGCNEEDRTPLSGERMVQVQLDVHTRAVDASTGKPTAEESDLHSLRIYAFDNSGQQVGHLNLTDGLDTSNPLLMDLKIKAEPTEQLLRFYAVANEGAMSTPGNEKTLDANTSETELKNFTFTLLKTPTSDNGLPMFATDEVTINTGNTSPQTESGHEGHYTLNEKVNFELERPVGKLGVFAAKVEGETETLTVTGAKILKEGTRMMNYLFPQTDEVLKQIVSKEEEIDLTLVTGGNVNTALSENISDEERKNPGNYTPLLEVPFYPFETPWGSASWNTPGDKRGAVLQIDYQFGNKTNTGLVYLPRIERNHYYAICCLMRNSGKITVEYVVADWNDGGNYELDFAYPTYFPIEPMEGADYSQPTVYYNPDPDSDEGTFKARFRLTAPEGQEWQPTLLNATPADYEITVYQSSEQGMQKVEPPYVASSSDYVIKIRALKSENVDRKVELGIGYIPRWDPGDMSLLQINWASGNTIWGGSDDPEKIVISQIDPTTVNP